MRIYLATAIEEGKGELLTRMGRERELHRLISYYIFCKAVLNPKEVNMLSYLKRGFYE